MSKMVPSVLLLFCANTMLAQQAVCTALTLGVCLISKATIVRCNLPPIHPSLHDPPPPLGGTVVTLGGVCKGGGYS